jgi:hypothetical protein
MQESSWAGQRNWGGVMNPTTGRMDGSTRNHGLVSWAEFPDTRERVARIENYLGKSIEQSSNSEQIKAMLWEMESFYPEAHAVFINPNSTDAQLQEASKAYWGYGHEGLRFDYARKIYSEL